MVLQSIKSKLADGFAQLSGLVLMAGGFLMVIGCPYSVEIREAGSWFGGGLLAGLTVYATYQLITRFKTTINQVLSQVNRLVKLSGNLIHAVNSFWLRVTPRQTSKPQNLRLPPDIFFAKEMVE